jgi:diadenosine tetraphosphate (Ap4A) HIT family hydrolase
MAYDNDNVFAKILRGELPANTVYEDEWAVAFHDINPQAPVHVLVIPRGSYISMIDFSTSAPEAEITGFFRAVGKVANALGLDDDGYRVLANAGSNAHQEVSHLHVHIFGGKRLGPMLVR